MPHEKATSNVGRPLKPVLAANRNVRSPVTPRLAASATPPLTRKSTQSDLGSVLRKTNSREQLSTPVQAFLNNNITPRSSSRKSRVDSAQSTPDNGSATVSTADAVVTDVQSDRNGPVNAFSNGLQKRAKSVVGAQSPSNSPALRSGLFIDTRMRSPEPSFDQDVESKFLRANDARSRSPEAPPTQKKAATFFYANGAQEETSGRPAPSPSPPLSAVSARHVKSQFFHANSSEVGGSPSLPSPPIVAPLPKPLSVEALQRAPAFFRPPSSDNIHLSYRKGASQVIKPGNRPNAIPLVSPTALQTPSARKRSGSSQAPTTQQHGKQHNRTSSLSSIDSPPRKSAGVSPDNAGYFGLSPLATNCHNTTNSGRSTPAQFGVPTTSSAPEPTDSRQSTSETNLKQPVTFQPGAGQSLASPTVPQSPTKSDSSGPQNLQQMSELAANARRERKVLDLEISNSSLLAINRQLEREVRKQKAELRRFRRLTRAGRLSGLNIAGHNKEDNDEAGEGASGADDGLSDEDVSFEEGNSSEDEDDSTDDSALSPSALAERDERKLAKDSKRLQLDLSRHRELLIDSQKMNQALKRCMAWTEEMIKDGKKALEYRVRVDEVRLGGRVLERENGGGEEEVEEEDEHHRLVSPWSPSSMPHLEASRDGILGLGIVRGCSWQGEVVAPPEEQLQDRITDLPVCGAEIEPFGEG